MELLELVKNYQSVLIFILIAKVVMFIIMFISILEISGNTNMTKTEIKSTNDMLEAIIKQNSALIDNIELLTKQNINLIQLTEEQNKILFGQNNMIRKLSESDHTS